MRLLLSCLVLEAALLAQSPCSIRGTVMDGLTMRPLAGTEVFADPEEDSALPVRRISNSGGDLDDLSLAYLTPVKVSIAIDEAKCSPPRNVRLEPGKDDIDPADEAVEAKATAADKFETVVWPGRYRIAVTADGPACFVKRLRVDGVAQSAHSFEIKNGTAASVDVALSSAPASIDGQAAAGGSTLLLENELEPDLSKEQVAGAYGRFQWNSLEPGKYRLYAFEDFDSEEWGNPRLAELLASKSLEFQIKEGEHRHVLVPLISVAEFQQALEKSAWEAAGSLAGILTRMPHSCCNIRVRSRSCPATN